MELLGMFDVARILLNLDIIYTALLFFPGEDPGGWCGVGAGVNWSFHLNMLCTQAPLAYKRC